MVRLIVPNAPGRLVLDLRLQAGEHAASNRYETLIV
jgi:hypothetical protein